MPGRVTEGFRHNRAMDTAQSLLPTNDPLREMLHNEVHARPPARIRLPALVVFIAVTNDGVSREQELAQHIDRIRTAQLGRR